ncbi:TPA: hypothetical protein EYP45_03230 [Candidatus Peregrinibacteria bacterium]|nr:hypothetical protein [Candidatus Peregrinibacteria bacterium]HIQ57344.1 hypothetical protein [Candidatus Gracilibacteria bacterium]
MNTYKKIFLPCLLLPLLTFSGCFDGTDTNDTETQEVKDTKNYSISIPNTWEIFPKNEFEKNMIFAARQGEYSSNVPITITISQTQSLPESLEILIKKNYEIVRRESQDFKIISETDFTTKEVRKEQTDENKTEQKKYINPEETREPASKLVIYTEKYTSNNSFAQIYSLNVLSYKEKKTYVINILCDMNASEKEKELIMDILTSFTIIL